MKICSECELEKRPQDFYKDPQKKDGLRSNCKKCVKAKELKPKEGFYRVNKNPMLYAR